MLKLKKCLIASIGTLALAVPMSNRTTLAQSNKNQAKDETAVRQACASYIAAIEQGDAKAVAEFWTADGTYTDASGKSYPARELVQKTFAGGKQQHSPIDVSSAKVRFLSSEVAVEDGTCGMLSIETSAESRRTDGSPASPAGHYSALWVKQDGKWKLDSLRESLEEVAPTAELKPAEELAILEPLIGTWSGSSGKLQMKFSAKWNSAKTFVHRELSISSDGKPVFSGSQEIGWDPHAGSIKSWVFNSDGGHGEGIWDFDGNSWIVLSTGTSLGGQETQNTQIFKFADKNTLDWRLIDGTLKGKSEPRLEFTLKRVQQ